MHFRSKPGYLDRLVEAVRQLKIVGIVLFSAWPRGDDGTNDQVLEAHRKFPDLGNPDYGEAWMMCRGHSNTYFDLSGSTLKKKTPAFFEEMLWWEKQKIRYRVRVWSRPLGLEEG